MPYVWRTVAKNGLLKGAGHPCAGFRPPLLAAAAGACTTLATTVFCSVHPAHPMAPKVPPRKAARVPSSTTASSSKAETKAFVFRKQEPLPWLSSWRPSWMTAFPKAEQPCVALVQHARELGECCRKQLFPLLRTPLGVMTCGSGQQEDETQRNEG